MKKYFFLILNVLITINLSDQVAVGDWRDHFAFSNVGQITENTSEIIAGCSDGIFTYNKSDNSINKLSKVNGLSDVGISALSYYEEKDVLFVGYSNGNIDIIVDKKITNIPDIKNKNISAAKIINNVVFKDDFAFLSCGFGIIKLDLINFEIADTYYIGENATLIEVFKIIYDENYFYVATQTGLYTAEVDSPNLSDYNNWTKIETIPNYNSKFTDILFFQDELYTLYYNESSNRKTVYKQTDGLWSVFKQQLNSKSSIYAKDDKFIITTPLEIFIYNQNGLNIRNIEYYNNQEDNINSNISYIDNDGTFWIGDSYLALIKELENYTYKIYKPNGPSYNTYGKLFYANNIIYSAGGGKQANGANMWKEGKLSWFNDEKWSFLSNDDAFDYYIMAANPNDPNNIFIGAWSKGVYEYNNMELTEFYHANNSAITGWLNMDNYVHISGLKFDEDGNLWSVNPSPQPLCVKTPEDDWYSFDFDGRIENDGTGNLVITENNNKWFPVQSQKVVVFDDKNTISNPDDDEFVILNIGDAEGGTVGNYFYALEKDLDDNIWVGTDEGVVVFFNTENAFEDGYHSNKIKISGEINDIIITGYLLENDVVTSIAVDGANRKWFGTEDSGVYLISEDGTKELFHFTSQNSPLPSNHFLSIIIHEVTGEVFFSTSYGIISYKGNSTTGEDDFENVFVYPNPVRPNYYGNIAITGLVSDVNVKITDVTGNIVFEAQALGGQVNWDGNNFSGQRVQTGVYLIFCSNEDGTKTHVTKLLFIN